MQEKKKSSDMSKAEKARDFVEFTNGRRKPFSVSALNGFYSISILFAVLMGFSVFVGLKKGGLLLESLFLAATISIWLFLYSLFKNKILLKITLNQSTFEYKFLAQGIFGLFISSLMWILFIGYDVIMKEIIYGFVISLLLLFMYLISSILYIGIINFFVHKGLYSKATKIIRSRIYLNVSAFLTAMSTPIVIFGLSLSRVFRRIASENTQNLVSVLALAFVLLCGILFHREFVAYYYCKKYKISCDENDNFTFLPPDKYTK